MNENNARLIQHLATNNPPPLAAPIPPKIEWSHYSRRLDDRESRSCQSTGRAEIVDADHRAYNRAEKKALLGEKEAPFRQNLSHPNELVK